MNDISIFGKLFEFRTQAHWLHLQTKSFEEHTALGGFYDELDSLLDKFIEVYFGRYDRLNGDFVNDVKAYGNIDLIFFIKSVYEHTTKLSMITSPNDTDLQNIVADMRELCNHTLYKLSLK